MVDGVKRRYDSTSRKRQAHENRSRILAAAHKLFVERGYGSTTVPEIAAAGQLSHLPPPGQVRPLGRVHVHGMLQCEGTFDTL